MNFCIAYSFDSFVGWQVGFCFVWFPTFLITTLEKFVRCWLTRLVKFGHPTYLFDFSCICNIRLPPFSLPVLSYRDKKGALLQRNWSVCGWISVLSFKYDWTYLVGVLLIYNASLLARSYFFCPSTSGHSPLVFLFKRSSTKICTKLFILLLLNWNFNRLGEGSNVNVRILSLLTAD